jgi:hypothetical protein
MDNRPLRQPTSYSSENGIAGYSYAMNGTPAFTVNTTGTSITIPTAGSGVNTFRVMAKGNNGVWGPVSSFQLAIQDPETNGPLPPWSVAVLILGVFGTGAWYISRQKQPGHSRS